jgi:hypothetical protein
MHHVHGEVPSSPTLIRLPPFLVQSNRVRWVQFYGSENGAEPVGRVQLSLLYALAGAGSAAAKWQPTTETAAYDILLGVVLRALGFRHRELQLYGPWRWLLDEFALYYGVSDSYTRLRYAQAARLPGKSYLHMVILGSEAMLPFLMVGAAPRQTGLR